MLFILPFTQTMSFPPHKANSDLGSLVHAYPQADNVTTLNISFHESFPPRAPYFVLDPQLKTKVGGIGY